jgi:hypothetical protein
MKWYRWLNENLKFVLIGLALLLLTSFLVTKCQNHRQQDATVGDAVAQNEIKNLRADLAALKKEKDRFLAAADSLLRQIDAQDKLLIQIRAERAQIALNLDKEKQRRHKLTNDSAVGLFLDRADCSECPVVKYDQDYIIPVEPIRFYNDLSADFDTELLDNISLRKENTVQATKINGLDMLCSNKDHQIAILEQQNSKNIDIQAEQNKQLQSEKDRYKAEHRKLVVTKIVAGVIIVVEAVAIGAALIL